MSVEEVVPVLPGEPLAAAPGEAAPGGRRALLAAGGDWAVETRGLNF